MCDKTQQYSTDPNHYYQQYGVPAQNSGIPVAPQQQQYYQQQYQTYYPVQGNNLRSWFDYKNQAYIKGAVVGAAATLILTNPTVKKALVKGVVGIWETLQGGVEEFKEQIRDVQAEKGEE